MVREIAIRNVEEEEEIQEIEDNLYRLTEGVPNISVNDLPKNYQCHNTGVLGIFGRLLHRFVHSIICYHEHED